MDSIRTLPQVGAEPHACPLAAVEQRLLDAFSLCLETKSYYFHPDRFRLSLNNTIQALPNVTFILQKSKSRLTDFDSWYSRWQDTMRSDCQMRWLVESRNLIVKQGDLETRSRARISVVDSWFESPKLELDGPPFMKSEELRRLFVVNRPKGMPIDVGLLKIERRWIDSRMPGNEILEILAHAFNTLSQLLYDAHVRLLDAIVSNECSWFHMLTSSTELLPPCLMGQEWDRTIWIDLRDGKIAMPVSKEVRPSETDLLRAAEHYKWSNNQKDKISAAAGDLKNEAAVWFEHAKNILQVDGYHRPIALLGFPDGRKAIFSMEMIDRTEKHLQIRRLAAYIEKTGATSVILINEAWLSRGSLPSSEHAEDDPNREETLQLIASDNEGQLFVHTAIFTRNAQEKIQFTEEIAASTDIIYMLQPIRDAWQRRNKGEGD